MILSRVGFYGMRIEYEMKYKRERRRRTFEGWEYEMRVMTHRGRGGWGEYLRGWV